MWNSKKTFDWKRTEYICDLQLRRFWQSTTFILEMRFRQMQKILNSSIFWSSAGKYWTWCKMHAKIFIMFPLLQKYSFSVVFQRIKNLKLFTIPTKSSFEKFRISVQSSEFWTKKRKYSVVENAANGYSMDLKMFEIWCFFTYKNTSKLENNLSSHQSEIKNE